MLRVSSTDVPQGTGHPPVHPSKVDIIASDRIEDRLLLAVKHYALPMAKDCGIVQFANLDQFPSESTQFQKFQGRSFTRRSSTENQINNTISELNNSNFFIRFHFYDSTHMSKKYWAYLFEFPSKMYTAKLNFYLLTVSTRYSCASNAGNPS